jgi:hypothetical protein
VLLLTDVDAVQDGYGTPHARPIHHATVDELRSRGYPDGSLGPKAGAACRFAAATGRIAVIGGWTTPRQWRTEGRHARDALSWRSTSAAALGRARWAGATMSPEGIT